MLHAVCLEQGLTLSRPSMDGNLCLHLYTLKSYFFLLLLVSPPHGDLRPFPRPRSSTSTSRGMEGHIWSHGSRWAWETQKVQVPTHLRSPGGPTKPQPHVQAHRPFLPFVHLWFPQHSVLFIWNTFASYLCLKPSPLKWLLHEGLA